MLQQPAKPVEKEKEEKVSPNAVALKMKQKKCLADVASEKQKFRPFKEIDQNQVFAKQAPQVSNPLFSAMPGSGRIGTGANTTLGTRFAGYAQQIQQLVAQKWHTNDVDARVQTEPVVIASFDLMRDGRIHNLRVVQQAAFPHCWTTRCSAPYWKQARFRRFLRDLIRIRPKLNSRSS